MKNLIREIYNPKKIMIKLSEKSFGNLLYI